MGVIERAQAALSFEDALAVLAQAQAEYNKLGKVVSTKDPDSLRSACDEEMRLRYEMQGVKSIDVKVGGETVATYSVSKTKEQPERRIRKLAIGGEDALRWLIGDAPGEYRERLAKEAVLIAEDYMLLSGEFLPGAEMVETVEPAVPSRFRSTVLKVDRAKLDKALASVEAAQIGEVSE